MRLLEITGSGEFSLTKDYIENIPRYAILSHTWGEDEEEVTYDDFMIGDPQSKIGYQKIQFCGKQAEKDGLRYFWVDTCCINKSNYTELSEAINSMFRWYRDAVTCYVYLSDVSTCGPGADESLSRTVWKLEFWQSRWLTRAWTLQELIAPTTVEFFSKDGERLGDKKSLGETLQERTGIPLEVFQGTSLDQYNVERRMLWAAERRAKRKEDEAYCLLGICGVTMTLNYGEGRDHAFQRLKEEIDKRSNNSSNIRRGNEHWMVPRASNDLFTGRHELLLRIEKALHIGSPSTTKKQKRFVITGLGGQGKSEICLQVANLMREVFWGIFWVDVDKPSTAKRDFIAIAKILGRSVESIHEALQVLATAKQDWLLILDNADDSTFDYQDYLPSGTHGAVLITSRIAECKRYSPNEFEALQGLEGEESKELLFQAAEIPEDSWPLCNAQAEEVVQLLGSHTLALIQAGVYIAKGHCKLHQYPKVYQRHRKRLLRYRPDQSRSRYHDVYTTFEASAEVLEQSESEASQDALCLLAILSMLDSAILPLQIFQSAWDGGRFVLHTSDAGTLNLDDTCQDHVLLLPRFLVAEDDEWDPYRLTEASSKLLSLSLVTRHDLDGSPGISMHPLTHAWAKDRQESEQRRVAWVATGCVLALSRFDSVMWRTQERRLLPHVQSYLNIKIRTALSFGSEGIIIPILLKCGWILAEMRQDARLSSFLEEIFVELDKNPEDPSREPLPLYDLQARSLSKIGKNKKAMALLEQVVKGKETMLPADNSSRIFSEHDLAVQYQANGKVKEAVELLEHVVKVQEKILAIDHPSRLASQHALAGAFLANGQVKEAVKLLEHVVKVKETILAIDHPDQLASQHALAGAFLANGQVKEAVKLLEHVVKVKETILAIDHPDQLASQHALAGAFLANGQVKEAVKLLEHVVKVKETILAIDHPDRLASQHALARAYLANGQVEEAIELLQYVVKVGETQAIDHPDQLASQHELADAFLANGQVKEAVELLEHVVKVQEKILAIDHPSRLASQHALAGAFLANGQVKEAVKLLEHVVKVKETILAIDHPDQLASQHALAGAFLANEQVKEAVKLLEHVVKVKETILAIDHPDRLASQHALARAYLANGQVEEAIELLQYVVKVGETQAIDHPDRLASQHELAVSYWSNGQVKEAVELFEEVVKISRSKLPANHPNRTASEEWLAYIRENS